MEMMFPAYFKLSVVFVLGAIIGSFFNVCIYRLPREEDIVFPSSRCPHCNENIKPWENIPLISYMFLLGKCSKCRKQIDFRYFLVEFLTAVFFAYSFYLNGFAVNAVFVQSVILYSVLVITFFIDLDYQFIFVDLLYYGAFAGLILSFFMPVDFYFCFINNFEFAVKLQPGLVNFINALSGGILGYLFFFAIRGISSFMAKQEAMGMGDVQLAFFIGIFLGINNSLLSYFISFFLGGMYSIPQLLLKKKNMKDAVAFGTFMSIGAVISLFWGRQIIYWYFNFGKF